ncbi:MAG: hypothetical protein ACJ8F7_09195, partial [Gemmataceae bacterium]
EALNTAKKLKTLQKTWTDSLYGSARLALLESHPKLGLRSEVGEDVQAFLARCREAAKQQGQAELQKAQAEYSVERQKLVAQLPPRAAPPEPSSPIWEMPVLSWFKPGPSKVVLGPPPTKADDRKYAKLTDQIQQLDADWQAQQAKAVQAWQAIGEAYSELLLTPRKADVRVTHFGVAWVPYWRLTYADGHSETAPAFARDERR